jgi:hypothetical protein
VKVTWDSLILKMKALCNIPEGLHHEISFESLILKREFKLLRSGENLQIKYYKNVLVVLWKKLRITSIKSKYSVKRKE